MGITKTEIKIEKRQAELLVYLMADALEIEFDRVDEGDSDFDQDELVEARKTLDTMARMINADAISLLGFLASEGT